MKKYINITASIGFSDANTDKSLRSNYKKIRLCNQADFEKVGYS